MKVGFAIIGAGVVAPHHAVAIKAIPEAELVSIVDVVPEKASDMQSVYDCKRSYTTLDECMADEAVDVVIVCTPSGTHEQLTVETAKSGKHVLCEKPLDIKADKMERMIQTCDEEGVKLGVVYPRRAMDTILIAKTMLDNGVFGKVSIASAYLKYYRSQEYYDSAGWRGTWAMDGGGALMNQGIHGVDIMQWLNGGVRKVFGRAAAMERHIEVEDTAVAVVEYHNGAFGVIEGSTLAYPGQMTKFELNGTQGTLTLDDQGIQTCETLAEKINPSDWGIEQSEIPANISSIGHYRFVHDIAKAVLEDRDPLVTGKEGKKAVDVILAIYESARSGKEIIL
ncbi:Gfo/Idh/MocA family oxidoreductase [Bacillaceae bacterium SIJ1]|nr:Gfo/Idh/MocA family oxidoreductase [Litoribacterium kuwaitense]